MRPGPRAGYGQPQAPEKRRWSPTDRRYSKARWRKVRLFVLARDGHRCWAPGCDRLANVADHVRPVTPTTTDQEFFDAAGIRASCRSHNLARALLTDQELTGTKPSRPPNVKDYTRREP